jgi:predicted transcriptional regulator
LKSIFKIIDAYVYPSVKRLLVKRLYEKGVGVSEIARRLGISKSLASRYLSGERGSALDFSKHRDMTIIIDRIADWIIAEKPDTLRIEYMLASITLYTMAKRYVCSLHARIDTTVDPSKCNLCPSLFGWTTKVAEQLMEKGEP